MSKRQCILNPNLTYSFKLDGNGNGCVVVKPLNERGFSFQHNKGTVLSRTTWIAFRFSDNLNEVEALDWAKMCGEIHNYVSLYGTLRQQQLLLGIQPD